MRKNKVGAIAIKNFAVLVLLAAYHGMAQDATTAYPDIAPIEQYMMDRTAEIALARSAAPQSISGDAEVLVLGRRGFETAVKGKNGFVCIVERGWTAASDPDFWNPKARVPICDNAAAARSYLLRTLKTTELALAGRTKAQLDHAIARRGRQKRTAGDGPWGDVLRDVEARIRRRQRPTLAALRHVFLFRDRPRKLGSESAGFSHNGC